MVLLMKKYLQMPFSTREYMLSKDFELFYYNDKHITPLKEHSHKYYEFYFFLGGEVSITIKKQTYNLEKGDMILLPPGVKHYVTIHDPDIAYQRFIFWITPEFASELHQISEDYVYLLQHSKTNQQYIYHFDTITFNTIQSKLFLLSDEIHFDHFGKAVKLSLAVKDLILHLSRVVYEMVNPQVTKELTYFINHYEGIRPALYLSYERCAMFSKEDSSLRITFDRNITTRRYDLGLHYGNYGDKLLPEDRWVMEVKANQAMPLWLAAILNECKVYPKSFSKYGTEYRNTFGTMNQKRQ